MFEYSVRKTNHLAKENSVIKQQQIAYNQIKESKSNLNFKKIIAMESVNFTNCFQSLKT